MSAAGIGVTPEQARAAIRAAAASLERRLDELVPAIGTRLRAEIPELAAARTADETNRIGAEIIGSFVESVRRGEAPAWTEHSTLSVDIVRGIAAVGAGPQVLMRLIQLGHAAVQAELESEIESLALAPHLRLAVLRRVDDLAFAFVDGYTQTVFEELARERRRLLRATELRRAGTVRSLLKGPPADHEAAGRTLGYDLSRHHTAMLLWADAADFPTRLMQNAADEVAHALGSTTGLLVFSEADCCWAWTATDGPPDARGLAELARSARRDRISVALGDSASGAAGFRSSHMDARAAMQVARLGGRHAGDIVLYRDVELAALALDDLERTRHFVLDTLGALAVADDENARLRATLRVFLDCAGSRRDAADRLGIHANTIGARVHTCEELLGDVELSGAELRTALALAAQLGAAVLH